MMDHLQSFTPLQPQAAIVEYAFPTVLQFLQSEWRRFERDRNEWDIEKSEMKAREQSRGQFVPVTMNI